MARYVGRQDYNYFRDYEPGTGRYVESDPIGLRGGVSTYGYALQTPLRYGDSSGLFVDELGTFTRVCAATTVSPFALAAAGVALLVIPNPTSNCDTIDTPKECGDECENLYRQIRALLDELKRRYWEMREDEHDLYNTRRTGSMSWAGHQQQFRNKQQTLRYLLELADRKGCTAYPPDAWSWATRDPPVMPAP